MKLDHVLTESFVRGSAPLTVLSLVVVFHCGMVCGVNMMDYCNLLCGLFAGLFRFPYV